MEALKSISGKAIINRETGIAAQIKRTQRDKLVSSKAREKSNANGFTNTQHFHAVANIDRLYENANLVEDRPPKENNPDIISIKRFVAPVILDSGYAEAYITVKETTDNKIYSIELDELKKPSDLKGGTLRERYHIPEGYDKLLRKIEKARAFQKKNEKNSIELSPSNGERNFVRDMNELNNKSFKQFWNGMRKNDLNPVDSVFATPNFSLVYFDWLCTK